MTTPPHQESNPGKERHGRRQSATSTSPQRRDAPPDREETNFLGAVLDAVPGLIFVFDEDDRIVWENRRVLERTGYSSQALRQMRLAELFGAPDAQALRRALHAVRTGSEGDPIDVTLRTRGDASLLCEFTGRPLPKRGDDPGRVVGIGRELTDREAHERALRRERDWLKALYAGLPSPVVHHEVQDGEAVIRGVNAAFEETFGLSEAEIRGQNLDALLTADGQARQAEILTRRALEEGSVEAEVVRETEEGPRYFRLNSVLFSAEEKPEGYAIYTDVTQQKEREQTLREEQEALRAMYRITADQEASFEQKVQRLIDLGRKYLNLPYGFLTRISDDTQRILRASGTHPLLQPGESCPLWKSYCRKTIQKENFLAVQNAIQEGWEEDPAYETFELGTYIGSQILVGGELYGTFCFAATEARDEPFSERERTFLELMTRWASYELEQRHATEQLERQNERLDSFASLVSHDLRNPLNVAKGRLELAKEEAPSPHLAAVDQALNRMDAIIEDVLTLTWSRQELDSDDLEYCDLARVAKECWTHVDTSHATLQTDAGPVIKAEKGRLQRLLENLFGNAVEHGGEKVTVWMGRLDDGFFVEDDGPGIPPEKRGDVLEAGFSSGKEGTGLGLSIAETIVTAHGWRLSITEGRRGGARFEITNVDIEAD